MFKFYYSDSLHNEQEKYISDQASYETKHLTKFLTRIKESFCNPGVLGLIVVVWFNRKGKKHEHLNQIIIL